MIRGLLVGEIDTKDYFKIVFKEIRVAAVCAAVLGAVNLLRVFLPGTDGIKNCAVVSLAIFVSVTAAKLVGASLPIIAKALKRDPATVGGPFIQSLSDIISLAVYFGIAGAILN